MDNKWLTAAPTSTQLKWVKAHRALPTTLYIAWLNSDEVPLTLEVAEALWPTKLPATTASELTEKIRDPETLEYILRNDRRKSVLQAALTNPHTRTSDITTLVEMKHLAQHQDLVSAADQAIMERGTWREVVKRRLQFNIRPETLVDAADDGADMSTFTHDARPRLGTLGSVPYGTMEPHKWARYFQAAVAAGLPIVAVDFTNEDNPDLGAIYDAVCLAVTEGSDVEQWNWFLSKTTFKNTEWDKYRRTPGVPRIQLHPDALPKSRLEWEVIQPLTKAEYEMFPSRSTATGAGKFRPGVDTLELLRSTYHHPTFAWGECITLDGDDYELVEIFDTWFRTTDMLPTIAWNSVRSAIYGNDYAREALAKVFPAIADNVRRAWQAGFYAVTTPVLVLARGGWHIGPAAEEFEDRLTQYLQKEWADFLHTLPLTGPTAHSVRVGSGGKFWNIAEEVFSQRLQETPAPGVALVLLENAAPYSKVADTVIDHLSAEDWEELANSFATRERSPLWVWCQEHPEVASRRVIPYLAVKFETNRDRFHKALAMGDFTVALEEGLIAGENIGIARYTNPQLMGQFAQKYLGVDLKKWELLNTLSNDWVGTFPELLETVVTMVDM